MGLSFRPANQGFDFSSKRNHTPGYKANFFGVPLDKVSGRISEELIDYSKIEKIVEFILTADPNDNDIEFGERTRRNLNRIRNIALSDRVKQIKALMILCHKDRETWYADIQQPTEAMRTEKESHIKALEKVISLLKEKAISEANSDINEEIKKLESEIHILQMEIKKLEKFIITDEEQQTVQGHEVRERKMLDEFINAMIPLAWQYAKENKIQLPRYLTPGLVPSVIRRTKTIANKSAELQLTLGAGIAIVSQLAQTMTQEIMYRMAKTGQIISKGAKNAVDDRPFRMKRFESQRTAENIEDGKRGLDKMHDMFGMAPEIISSIMNAASILSIARLLYTIGSLVPQADMGNFSEKALDNKRLQRMVGLTIIATIIAMAFGDAMGYFLINSLEPIFGGGTASPPPYNPNPGH